MKLNELLDELIIYFKVPSIDNGNEIVRGRITRTLNELGYNDSEDYGNLSFNLFTMNRVDKSELLREIKNKYKEVR